MKEELITIFWMFAFFIPTIVVTGFLINNIEWYILIPLQFLSTVSLVLLFFKYVKWRNKKKKFTIKTLG